MKRFGKHSWLMVTVIMTAAIIVHAQSADFMPGAQISAAAVNARFAALETPLVTMTLTPTDADPNVTDFANACLNGINASTNPNGGQFIPIGCTLAAQRKCTGLKFRYGYFVGEGNNVGRTIVCIK